MNAASKPYFTFTILISLMFLVAACSGTQSQTQTAPITGGSSETSGSSSGSIPLWMDAELKDVRTGQTFKISDFKGKPVLVESFAVWCPICKQQQKNTKKLEAEAGNEIVSVSINTDPNEDEERIRNHITRNDFTWLYAISPIEVTRSLIDQFGRQVVNVPLVPIILVCPDQSTKLLPFGVKSAERLKAEVAQGCSA